MATRSQSTRRRRSFIGRIAMEDEHGPAAVDIGRDFFNEGVAPREAWILQQGIASVDLEHHQPIRSLVFNQPGRDGVVDGVVLRWEGVIVEGADIPRGEHLPRRKLWS